MKTTNGTTKPLPPAPTPLRVQVLKEAIQIVGQDRNATHGEPEDSFAAIADYWTAHLTHAGKLADGETISRADVAVMMAGMKLARLAVNPTHRDNWIDTAGYAACGPECAEKDRKEDVEGLPPDVVEIRRRRVTAT